jgi:hypothetical protein
MEGVLHMIRMTAAVAVAAMIAASAAQAQNAPPPGNVNPGSQSGQEQTGAPNQPRSGNYGAIKGTTGSGISSPDTNPAVDGTNANVKPSSPESGSESSGEPAGERR